MLQEIYINNFVLIEEQRLDFTAGLNVLTGETGAGKSIIIDALGLLLGERTKNEYVRDENKKAIIEAVFDLQHCHEASVFLSDQDLLDGEQSDLIISREFYPNGRNTARVNGRNVNIHTLKILGDMLVDTQLQNDRYDFLNNNKYLAYVDGFGGSNRELSGTVSALYYQSKDLEEQLESLQSQQQMRSQRIDYLSFQIKEIEDSSLQAGEEEELKDLRERIHNAKKLLEASHSMVELLYSSEQTATAYDSIAAALTIVIGLKEDRFFHNLAEPLENISHTLQDISRQLVSFRDSLDFEPDLLEKVEDRLYLISKMKNKYGASLEDIITFLATARSELETLQHSDERLDELRTELMQVQVQYDQFAEALTAQRKSAAQRLEQNVAQEMVGLNMPHVRFQIEIKERKQPGPKGKDEIDFLFSSNPGEELRAVSKIASGGEISRLILALKIALAEVYQVPTLIFDEIDVGLGGTALSSMAKKLADLATTYQVILVTHSAQLASFAQQHLLIDKQVENERSFTRVKVLDQEARIQEIARMLDGEKYSDLTLEHAREMLHKPSS